MYSCMDWVFLVFPLTTLLGCFTGFSSLVNIKWSAKHLVGVLLEKEFNISIMLVSRSAKFLENLVDSFVWLTKTQWTDRCFHQQLSWHPDNHRTENQIPLVLCLSTLLPDSTILISRRNAKYIFFLREEFGPLDNTHFIFSPGMTLTVWFLFQKWHRHQFLWSTWI